MHFLEQKKHIVNLKCKNEKICKLDIKVWCKDSDSDKWINFFFLSQLLVFVNVEQKEKSDFTSRSDFFCPAILHRVSFISQRIPSHFHFQYVKSLALNAKKFE